MPHSSQQLVTPPIVHIFTVNMYKQSSRVSRKAIGQSWDASQYVAAHGFHGGLFLFTFFLLPSSYIYTSVVCQCGFYLHPFAVKKINPPLVHSLHSSHIQRICSVSLTPYTSYEVQVLAL